MSKEPKRVRQSLADIDPTLESSFDEVDVVKITTTLGTMKIISINELPLQEMLKLSILPEPEKMGQMVKLVETCLVNPKDWEKFQLLSTKEVMKFINFWMRRSATTPSALEAQNDERDVWDDFNDGE
jgi:hypothetical protein